MTATTKTTTFIGFTVGLMASRNRDARLTKVEFNRTASGGVSLTAVSGHNGSKVARVPVVAISAEEFADRPVNPYSSTTEAIWALEKLGFRVAGI